MFLSLLLNISLAFVPLIFYSFCGMLAVSNLAVILPKLFTRNVIDWPVQNTQLTQVELMYRNLTGDNYCERGELLNPLNAITYFHTRTTLLLLPNEYPGTLNSSHIEQISQTFQTIILDCPAFSHENHSSSAPEEDQKVLSITYNYVRVIATFNSQQEGHKPKIKIWLLPHSNYNNQLNFESFQCTALALAGNRLHPGTVQGVILHGEMITPSASLQKPTKEFGTYAKLWKKHSKIFDFKVGLMFSLPSCMGLRNRPTLSKMLEYFDEIFYYRMSGSAVFNFEEGATSIVSKKFQACRSLVAVKAPKAMGVKHVLQELHLVFRRVSNYRNYCLVYDWIV